MTREHPHWSVAGPRAERPLPGPRASWAVRHPAGILGCPSPAGILGCPSPAGILGLNVTHSDAFAVPMRSRSETEETQPPFLQEACEPFSSCPHFPAYIVLSCSGGFSAINKTKSEHLSLSTTHWPTVNSDSVMKLGALVGTGASEMKAVEES